MPPEIYSRRRPVSLCHPRSGYPRKNQHHRRRERDAWLRWRWWPGPVRPFQLGIFAALAVDSTGYILVADEGNGRIRKITSDGTVTDHCRQWTVPLLRRRWPATSATLYLPVSIAKNSSGDILFTEPGVERIRRIAPDGTISVYAGDGALGYSGDGGPATSAMLGSPNYLRLLLQWRSVLHRRKQLRDPLHHHQRHHQHLCRQRLRCETSGDGGPASMAGFSGLAGLDFDTAGDLIVSQSFDNRIREVLANGNVVNAGRRWDRGLLR